MFRYVLWRRAWPDDGVRPGNYALHQREHHRAADVERVPALEALKKEGESGRKRMNQYTRYLTC